MTTMNPDRLSGMNVVTHDGHHLGTVVSVDIDTERWEVPSIAIRVDRHVCAQLGLHQKPFGRHLVHIRTDHIGAVGDTVVLDAGLDELRESREAVLKSSVPPAAAA